MTTTHVRRRLRAPRDRVYRALTEADAVAQWRVPAEMRCEVLAWDAREGGALRISLTYAADDRAGKTTAHTDTYRGRFLELVPNERVVEVDEFEADDPGLRGEMRITITLADADGGTELLAVHEGLPPDVVAADNETGWQEAIARLARLVEAQAPPGAEQGSATPGHTSASSRSLTG